MKTRQEIERLKAGWHGDPCWDIEATEGFEDHQDELREFRLASEATWKAAADAKEATLDAEADALGTRGLLRLVRQIEALQQRHAAALFHLTEGQSEAAWRILSGRENA